jgi:hypothetical protein
MENLTNDQKQRIAEAFQARSAEEGKVHPDNLQTLLQDLG